MQICVVKKYLLAVMIGVIALLPIAVRAELSSKSSHAVIMDADSHDVLFSHKGNEKMVPSSMTKIMTLYLLFERLNAGVMKLDDRLHVSEKAWRMGGSKMFVRVNTDVFVEDLIRGIVVQSGNDACIVVAEAIAGSEEDFAQRMNAKAKDIGMKNTHFVNATGWPDENHYSSAYDLALLSSRLIKDFPEYYHYFSEKVFTYNNIRQSNRNLLLWRDSTGVDGLKTGHTQAGGYGIVISGKEDERRMIVVVNGLESTKERSEEAERLLSHGFRYYERATLLEAGKVVSAVPVWQGEMDAVNVKVKEKVNLLLPKIGKEKTAISLHYNTPLVAPVDADMEVGELHIKVPGQEVAKIIPVYTAERVEQQGILGRVMGALMQ